MDRTDRPPHRVRRLRELFAHLVCLALIGACARAPDGGPEVVLYYSADDYVARPVIEAFEQETGVSVLALGDTEATKTTGLVQRLRAEKGSPRADVFWSSEVFLTIQLADEGIFAPLGTGDELETLPPGLAEPEGLWRGFALRARVTVYNTERVAPDEAPRTLHDLLDARWRGRIVMARPQFGTTRGHMGALVEFWGEEATRAWLRGLAANNVRLLDGNASVVRAVASGEALIGLTDTDDVWSGQRNGWPIDLVYSRHDHDGRSIGPLLIPNTVAVIAGGPNADGAQRLARFLLSERVERMLAESDSHNVPTRPGVAADFAQYSVPDPATADYRAIAASMEAALRLCDEALPP